MASNISLTTSNEVLLLGAQCRGVLPYYEIHALHHNTQQYDSHDITILHHTPTSSVFWLDCRYVLGSGITMEVSREIRIEDEIGIRIGIEIGI